MVQCQGHSCYTTCTNCEWIKLHIIYFYVHVLGRDEVCMISYKWNSQTSSFFGKLQAIRLQQQSRSRSIGEVWFILVPSWSQKFWRLFCTPVVRCNISWSGDFRPFMSPSVTVLTLSSYMLAYDILSFNFVYDFIFMNVRSSSNAINFSKKSFCRFVHVGSNLSTIPVFRIQIGENSTEENRMEQWGTLSYMI